MDVEKTMQFILETQARLEASASMHDERLSRIERLVESNTARITQLVDVSLSLARHGEGTDRRIRELSELSQENDRRIKELSESTEYKLRGLIDAVDKLIRRDENPPSTGETGDN